MEQQLSYVASEEIERDGTMALSDEEVLEEAMARAQQERSLKAGSREGRRQGGGGRAAAAEAAAAEAAVAVAAAAGEAAAGVAVTAMAEAAASSPLAKSRIGRQPWAFCSGLVRWKKRTRREQGLQKNRRK